MTEADNQLVPHQEPTKLATVMGVSPKDMLEYMLDVSDRLQRVIKERGLSRSFGGAKDHVEAAGWQLAGSFMGFVSSEGECKELPDGSYEAIMHLRHMATGRIVATGSARCGVDEPNWKYKPKFQRRSMAFTRANGRVYSQNFRWVIELAGYAGTPAEEMIEPVKPTEKKVEPLSEISFLYDAEKNEDKWWLRRILEGKKISQDKWPHISALLNQRPKADLEAAISEFTAKG